VIAGETYDVISICFSVQSTATTLLPRRNHWAPVNGGQENRTPVRSNRHCILL